ncbi:hypothetical protein PENTCL1PPCAC_9388, partial [Pristionchus entomophagus]
FGEQVFINSKCASSVIDNYIHSGDLHDRLAVVVVMTVSVSATVSVVHGVDVDVGVTVCRLVVSSAHVSDGRVVRGDVHDVNVGSRLAVGRDVVRVVVGMAVGHA